eukprot:scaffold15_cov354-Prasinococcus_capsulatus_cf.AAC.2
MLCCSLATACSRASPAWLSSRARKALKATKRWLSRSRSILLLAACATRSLGRSLRERSRHAHRLSTVVSSRMLHMASSVSTPIDRRSPIRRMVPWTAPNVTALLSAPQGSELEAANTLLLSSESGSDEPSSMAATTCVSVDCPVAVDAASPSAVGSSSRHAASASCSSAVQLSAEGVSAEPGAPFTSSSLSRSLLSCTPAIHPAAATLPAPAGAPCWGSARRSRRPAPASAAARAPSACACYGPRARLPLKQERRRELDVRCRGRCRRRLLTPELELPLLGCGGMCGRACSREVETASRNRLLGLLAAAGTVCARWRRIVLRWLRRLRLCLRYWSVVLRGALPLGRLAIVCRC